MGRSCSHIDCYGPCKKVAPKKKKWIRKVSKKRVVENRKYSGLRKQFLEGKICEAQLNGCTGQATQVHHAAGRIGSRLVDVKKFVAVCASCHRQIEDSPEKANKLGLSKSRLSNH